MFCNLFNPSPDGSGLNKLQNTHSHENYHTNLMLPGLNPTSIISHPGYVAVGTISHPGYVAVSITPGIYGGEYPYHTRDMWR